MGLIFRRRLPVNRSTYVNVSRSGASLSKRVGPVTMNSKGARIRFGRGLSYRIKF